MKRKEKIDFSDIPELTAAQLKRFRPATPKEVELGRLAIQNTLGIPRPKRVGRPLKYASGKLRGVYIRLHPEVIAWAKREAQKRHIGYHTFLSDWLMHRARATRSS
jgi:hypothetical protein